ADGSGITFLVESLPAGGPPRPLGGPYLCGTSSSLVVTFGTPDSEPGAVQSCSITILHAGTEDVAHATGTFAADVRVTGGATKHIPDGAFDLAVQGTGSP